jgi:hypothetical protein
VKFGLLGKFRPDVIINRFDSRSPEQPNVIIYTFCNAKFPLIPTNDENSFPEQLKSQLGKLKRLFF